MADAALQLFRVVLDVAVQRSAQPAALSLNRYSISLLLYFIAVCIVDS